MQSFWGPVLGIWPRAHVHALMSAPKVLFCFLCTLLETYELFLCCESSFRKIFFFGGRVFI